jgi:hypothetical protein
LVLAACARRTYRCNRGRLPLLLLGFRRSRYISRCDLLRYRRSRAVACGRSPRSQWPSWHRGLGPQCGGVSRAEDRCADQLLDEGDMAGAETTWHRILNAIERLQAKAPAEGGRACCGISCAVVRCESAACCLGIVPCGQRRMLGTTQPRPHPAGLFFIRQSKHGRRRMGRASAPPLPADSRAPMSTLRYLARSDCGYHHCCDDKHELNRGQQQ